MTFRVLGKINLSISKDAYWTGLIDTLPAKAGRVSTVHSTVLAKYLKMIMLYIFWQNLNK